VKQAEGPRGRVEELLKGPLDLLRWYQDFVLVELVPTKLASKRRAFVKKHLPEGSLLELSNILRNNLGAWPDASGVARLEEAIRKRNDEYTAEMAAGTNGTLLEEKYRLKIGYDVLDICGKSLFKTLFAP
jgi:hypothetical protein